MSTRTAALPVERSYLARAWMVVAAVVIVPAIAIAAGLVASIDRTNPGAGGADDPTTRIVDYGPATSDHGPLVVNGTVCGQCR